MTACAASLPLAACGGGDKQDADEPSGNFSVQVTRASFPKQQRLAKTALMAIAVRNVGKDDLPTVAVTLRRGGGGSGAPGRASTPSATARPRRGSRIPRGRSGSSTAVPGR